MSLDVAPGDSALPELLGGAVDEAFLALPRVAGLFRKPRPVDRRTLEKELDYYFEQGFIENPRLFFTFPHTLPSHEILETKPFPSGMRQVIGFASPYAPRNPLVAGRFSSFPENRTGYLVRWTHGREGVKTVLCLHGYLLGHPGQAQRMFRIDKLFGMGLDVALFITPFHWRRRPARRSLRGIFLQPGDPAMTCECFGQAVSDLAASFGILERLGSGPVGVIGASLGGYLAGLFSCLQDTPDFTAMMVPAVDFSTPAGPETAKLPFPVDTSLLEKMRRVYTLHSPLNFLPRVPISRILVVASRGDRLCPFDKTRLLCGRWGWPELHALRGGHWLVFDSRRRGRAWYSFLRRMGFLHTEDLKNTLPSCT